MNQQISHNDIADGARDRRFPARVAALTTALAAALTLGAMAAPPTWASSVASSHPARIALTRDFDNIGITSSANVAKGNLDGAGDSFSATALHADHANPGATITSDGVKFTWPSARAGQKDNVLAEGQTIKVIGSGRKLSFLVTAGYGPASGFGLVKYHGESSQRFRLTAPDWHLNCSRKGAGVVLYTAKRNGPHTPLSACVYFISVGLRAGRALSGIVLPKVSTGAVAHKPSLHVFAITIS
jgi:alpha-L-fucosidase 2